MILNKIKIVTYNFHANKYPLIKINRIHLLPEINSGAHYQSAQAVPINRSNLRCLSGNHISLESDSVF